MKDGSPASLAATPAAAFHELVHLPVALLGRPGPLVARCPGRPRERGIEDERAHALGIGGGEQRRQRAALERARDGHALRAGGVHHRQHVVHLLLERGRSPERVGQPRAAPVEGDHLRPQVLDLGDPGRDPDEVDGSVAHDDVGDMEVAALGVARHWSHGNDVTRAG
jgi:hypothetical protein